MFRDGSRLTTYVGSDIPLSVTTHSPAFDSLEARRASLKPEARALVRLLAEQIDAGVRLRLVRDALGLTQTEVAEIAGVTQADISRIESGQVSPTVDRMSRILRRLNEWAEGS
jgi:DNA-binding XRE family transcriptional regulator